MPRFKSPPTPKRDDAVGVLIVNLGTPDAPSPPAVRRYLREFLSDPRVVEAPRWLWSLALNAVILPFRPRRSAAAYRKIWTDEGSPLLVHSLALASSMQRILSHQLAGVVDVRAAMTYGNPGIEAELDRMQHRGVSRVLVLPLYPQYSASTTGAAFDAVARAVKRLRVVPETRFVSHYYYYSDYIAALADSVREAWKRRARGERLLFSFHGIPRRMVEKGDPYQQHCEATAHAVAATLGIDEERWQLSYQSRVGREEWLRPYTDETLRQWGERRMGDVDVVCPGFAVDCLETLEEIAMQNAERFKAAGGGELRYIPALNARREHVAFLCDLVRAHVAGWHDNVVTENRAGGASSAARLRAHDFGTLH